MKQYSAVFAAALSISLMGPALAQQANSPVGEPMNQSARASATMEEKGLIATDMRPRFRTYVTTQAPASFTYSAPVAVGTVLPQAGVTYYDVPADYGVTRYRYTVVNGSPVLVDPGTRRVIQVIQ